MTNRWDGLTVRLAVVGWVLGFGVTLSARAMAAATPSESCTRAEMIFDAAQMSEDNVERYRLADMVVKLCERAAEADPVDAEAVIRIVHALTISDVGHPEACRPGRCEDALQRLEQLRTRDKLGIEASRTASEEGIVLSRMLRFKEALAAYERALPLVDASRRPNSLDERQSMVLLWGNSAETAMALGRLDEAIRRYELALDASSYGETEWQLAQYGLGVALDRDGQGELAKRTIAHALERDPSLARLHDDGVFFEPPGDVAYYEGLAHEVAGDSWWAKDAFERFVKAQPKSPHVARARWHIAQLGLVPPPPKHHIEVGTPLMVRGRRSTDSIRARIAMHMGELDICYARYLRRAPGTSISVQLALEISPAGFVAQRAHVLSTSESALELTRCVELSADNWRFTPLTPLGQSNPPGDDSEAALVPLDFVPTAR